MDVMKLDCGDSLVVLDDQVLEVFRRIVAGSQRTPLVWAGVELKAK